MFVKRKYILSLDDGNLIFDIYRNNGLLMSIPTWLSYEDVTAIELYGLLRINCSFVCNIEFEENEHNTHIIWDDLKNYSVHYRLPRSEWLKFLYYVKLETEEQKINWIKEGF